MTPGRLFAPSTSLLRQFQTRPSGVARSHACVRSSPTRHMPRGSGRQVRHASTGRPTWSEWKEDVRSLLSHQMRENPIMFPVALVGTTAAMMALVYATYLHAKVRAEMASYPEAVGVKLRRAIYFTEHDPDPAQAAKAYIGALRAAQELQMHPLSGEVLGIWTTMAGFLEKFGNLQEAINVYDSVRSDCLKWIDLHGNEEGNAPDRTRLLQMSIQVSHKIAELYSQPQCADSDKVEEYLTWSVTTGLRENERRQREGLKPGEGSFYDANDTGAQLEALGQHYEAKDNHYLASQLFLKALSVKPQQDCHSVVLMNNLAACLAQQRPLAEGGMQGPSRQQLQDSGKRWVTKALELGRRIAAPQRTAECDEGCAVATHNLGEFAEMEGKVAEARELYAEAHSLAHAIGFEDGMAAAREGLARLGRRQS